MRVDQKQPLRVSVYGLTEKMRNTLQYFFHGPCNDYYEMVDDGSSVLSVIDLDGLNGQQSLQDHRTRTPEKPLIVLSVNNKEIEGAILVHKPLQTEKFISALETAQQKMRHSTLSDLPPSKVQTQSEQPVNADTYRGANTQKPANTPVHTTAGKNNSVSAVPVKPAGSNETKNENSPVSGTKSRSETHQAAIYLDLHDERSFIGSAPDIDHTDPKQLANTQYNPELYFQGYINQAVIQAGVSGQAVLLTIPEGWVVIRPKSQSVLINIKESKLRAFSALPITDQTITRSVLKQSDLSKYSQQAELMGLEQLLWKTAIWSCRGRLPTGTSLTSSVSFRHWPNLSRLQLPPHALRIAALWSENPCSLVDTAKALQIPQRYVFAFYSACNAIDVAAVEPESTDNISKPLPLQKNHKRAFFRRILERLKGRH